MIVRPGIAADIPAIMPIMASAFDPEFGEAWTAAQCLSALALPGTMMVIANVEGDIAGFALARGVLDEAELLLIAVAGQRRRQGVGGALLQAIVDTLRVKKLHLEMRTDNPAIEFYTRFGFQSVGRRPNYYRGHAGRLLDAVTLSRLFP